ERETFLKARALLETLELGEHGGQKMDPDPVAEQERDPADLPGRDMKVLLVDHEDSFVNTLADYVRRHGAEATTVRHDFAPSLLDRWTPDLVILSPGPGLPADFAMSALLDELAARRLPVFGVCLGCRAWSSTPGESYVPWTSPCTASPAESGSR